MKIIDHLKDAYANDSKSVLIYFVVGFLIGSIVGTVMS